MAQFLSQSVIDGIQIFIRIIFGKKYSCCHIFLKGFTVSERSKCVQWGAAHICSALLEVCEAEDRQESELIE